ncbi:hypothetical protein [Actinomycetospora cinnamomea]|uniref:hypothetical protein n=1 Tax=Actinomycetospora cinnamomea TaxID=663609 RepID=UPI001403FA9F|nr:hypothetical protein [Actinomycetospora cinnamomea]
MGDDLRVTTVIVGLLIAFCALLLAKWLALVAFAALLLALVLRFAVRRVVRAVRSRRAPVEPVSDTALDRAGGAALDRAGDRRAPVVPVTARTGAPCSWCGLVGGHHDLAGRPVRPRHAHALPAPTRRAS